MENSYILKIGLTAFFAALPMCGALYLIGEHRMAIGILAMTIPFTLLGFVMKLYEEYMIDIEHKLKRLL